MRGVKRPYPEPFRIDGRGVYYFNYRDPRTGKRRRKSTGCSRKTDALVEIKRYIDQLSSTTATERDQPFHQYADPFYLDGKCPRQARKHDERERFSIRHMNDMRHGLERVIGRPGTDRKQRYRRRSFADLLVGQITRADVYALRRELARDPGGRAGQRAFTAVKTVLAEAAILGHLEVSPAQGVGPYKRPPAGSGESGAERRRGAFTIEEIRLLWRHRFELTESRYKYARGFGREAIRDIRHGVALGLLLGMGLRVGELRALRWRHVHLETESLDVIEAVQDQSAAAPIGPPKWGKLRIGLSIPKPIADDLRELRSAMATAGPEYIAPDVPVITDASGGIVGPTWVSAMWKHVEEKAPDVGIQFGDRWLTPHSCRHSLNTWLLIEGAPPLQVQEFLGWESDAGRALAAMQQHYGHFELAGTAAVAATIAALIQPDVSQESGPRIQQA